MTDYEHTSNYILSHRRDTESVDTAKCISCMRCISLCPIGASEGAAVAEVVVDDYVAAGAGVLSQQVAGDGGGIGVVVLPHRAEVVVCLKHGACIGKVELCQKHKECQSVVEAAHEKRARAVAAWQILVEQQQIVAEVEIRLARIPGRQAATAKMIDNAGVNVAYVVAK